MAGAVGPLHRVFPWLVTCLAETDQAPSMCRTPGRGDLDTNDLAHRALQGWGSWALCCSQQGSVQEASSRTWGTRMLGSLLKLVRGGWQQNGVTILVT